jgi:LuxR family maltose regulon positive regulatory protein
MGRRNEVDQTLDLLQEFVRESGDLVSLAIADSCRARVALWRGDPVRASRLLPPHPGTPDPAAMVFFVEVPGVTHCRVPLAKGDRDEVAPLVKMLADLRNGLEGLHNTFQLVDVMVLQACAHQLMGEPGKAKEPFEAALQLAEPGWWIRPFLEIGEAAIPILDVVASDPSPFREELRSRLLEHESPGKDQIATPDGGSAAKGNAEQPLIEPLTNRELDVLELIAERLYDKEIADRLSVSPGTVKSHLKHIYQKLGVGNRRAAVERATALGILDLGS